MEWLFTAGVGLVGVVLWLWEKNLKADVEKKLMVVEVALERVTGKWQQAEDAAFRAEKVIAFLKGDLHELQKQMEFCATPELIRARLTKLLSTPLRDR